MKKYLIILSFLLPSICVLAQPPQKMSYQAVIRDAANNLISNSAVGMRISVVQGSPTGTVVFSETNNASTNVNGLLTIEIGGGSAITGTFSNIPWASGPFYLKTEADPTGGTNYTLTTISQLLSVPYSLYSQTSGDASNVKTLIYAGF